MNSIGKAIQLICYNTKDGFYVSPEGKTFLQSLKNKVGVIAVAGKYRTGKSFLLNRVIMGRLKGGFGVGSTINACTKGIWIWDQPIKIKTNEGEEFDALIMDSEGIGGINEDQNHDTRIFLLATLLSSLLIYNSVGTIDENALQNISLIVNMSKQLQIRSNPGKDYDSEDLKSYFPSFLWVLRDFALRLTDAKGNPISPRAYLESSLLPQKGTSENAETKNRVRKAITGVFNERDCFPLIRPLEDEKGIQILQNLKDTELRPEFVVQMKQLRKQICAKVKPKKINGNFVTGNMLLELCNSYTRSFNSGELPCIENAWKSMCKFHSQRIMDNLIDNYENELNKRVKECEYDPEQINKIENELKEKFFKEFKAESIGDSSSEYMDELNKKFMDKSEEVKKISIEKIMVKSLINIIGSF